MLGLSRQQRLQAVGVLSPKPVLKRLSVSLQRVSAEQFCVRSHGAPGDEDRRCDSSGGTDVRRQMDSMNAEDVSATDGIVDEDRSSKLGVVGAPALDGIGDGNSSSEVEDEACRGDEGSDCGVSTNSELHHRVNSMNAEDIGAAADGGDGDRSKETGVEEAPATAADGEDAVVRPRSKVSRKRKADQQSGGPDTGVGDCLESEKQSCLADKCTKSLCSIVGLSKFSSLPSADVDVPEAVLIPVPSRSDLEMTLGHCPASADQASVTTLASSGLNSTAQEDDAMELPGDEVEQTEGEARHGAVSDEDRGNCGVGTDPKLHHQVNCMNAEDIGADGGDGDRSKETGVEEAPATAAGGEDAVVRPRSKVSRKRKADQPSAGPETTELKQSCLADKRTASLSSSSSSSKSTILLSPDFPIPETLHTSVLSGSDLEQTAGHRHAALHWNSLATSDLKKNLEEDDAVKLSGKESEQREGEARTAVTAGSRIAAPSTPTVASCTQFRDSLRLTSHPAVPQDGGVVDDDGAADDGDRGPDGVWNHRGGDVGGRRRRLARRGASRCRRGPSSTGPALDPGDDAAGRERGCGRVRGRRFGRRRGGGGGRGRRSGRSSADPTHHDGTGGDSGVNEIASSEYSSFLRQLTAMPPVFGVDASSTRQDAPTAGYTGKQNVGFDLK